MTRPQTLADRPRIVAEDEAVCPRCGRNWPETETIQADGELRCGCVAESAQFATQGELCGTEYTLPRCRACGSTLLSTLKLNSGAVVVYCRRCGKVTDA